MAPAAGRSIADRASIRLRGGYAPVLAVLLRDVFVYLAVTRDGASSADEPHAPADLHEPRVVAQRREQHAEHQVLHPRVAVAVRALEVFEGAVLLAAERVDLRELVRGAV